MPSSSPAARSSASSTSAARQRRLRLSVGLRGRLQQARRVRCRRHDARAINLQIRELMSEGNGTIVVHNPGAKHSLGVGILNRLKLISKARSAISAAACSTDRTSTSRAASAGRAPRTCWPAPSSSRRTPARSFGAAIRGGDLVCKGDVGARTGIDQKGGTIMVGGRTGAFSGFMMQRGRMVILRRRRQEPRRLHVRRHDLCRRQDRRASASTRSRAR